MSPLDFIGVCFLSPLKFLVVEVRQTLHKKVRKPVNGLQLVDMRKQLVDMSEEYMIKENDLQVNGESSSAGREQFG